MIVTSTLKLPSPDFLPGSGVTRNGIRRMISASARFVLMSGGSTAGRPNTYIQPQNLQRISSLIFWNHNTRVHNRESSSTTAYCDLYGSHCIRLCLCLCAPSVWPSVFVPVSVYRSLPCVWVREVSPHQCLPLCAKCPRDVPYARHTSA